MPQITSVDTALKIYYSCSEIGNKEIKELFGSRSSATVSKLKKQAKNEMIRRDITTHSPNKINTEIAYAIWNIDIGDLEDRLKSLRRLKL